MKFYDIQEPNTDSSEEFITKSSNDEIAVGIDLGTTNSLIAFAKNEHEVEIIHNGPHSFTPSIVAHMDGKFIVGNKALALPNRIHSVKRHMKDAARPVLDKFSAVEISAEILKSLKFQAEKYLNREVSKAVITVPAYFDETSRQATKDAACLANIEVLRLISEPTSAALAYGIDSKGDGIYVVYDLGGGTFDISILKFTRGVFQVLATNGDSNLGGDDFDSAIIKHLKLEETNESLIAAREIKEYLSQNEKWENGATILTREDFEELISPLVNRTIQLFKNCIKDASISIEEIKDILLVGGATRTPLVKQAIEQEFKKAPLDNIDPDKIVAVGAALQAFSLTKGSNSLLLDVTPLSLGIEVGEGIVDNIIPRNTPIPVSRKQTFTTGKDNQTGFIVHVLQGESEKVKECRSLAKFELKNIPALPAGFAKLEVSFNIDADGLLSIKAKETSHNIAQEIQVKPSYGLDEKQILNLILAASNHTV